MSAVPRQNPLELNPLWLKGVWSRCRIRHLASWGVLWLTLATFVSLLVYLVLTEQERASTADAAKWSLLGILIIQAIILMFFGTGAVALGVSQERDEQLLDYVAHDPDEPDGQDPRVLVRAAGSGVHPRRADDAAGAGRGTGQRF